MRWLVFARTVTRVAGIGLFCDHGGVAVGLAMHTVEDLLTGVPQGPGPIAPSFSLCLHGMASLFMMAMSIINIPLPIGGGGALPRPGPNHSFQEGPRESEGFPWHASISQPTCGVIMACPAMNMLAP